jgi:hypothetical protein
VPWARSGSPSAAAFTSSGVIGVPSGPVSTTLPVMVVPGTAAVLTVVKLSERSLPGVPFSAASSSVPSLPLIFSPCTCSVTVEPPGMALLKNSQAAVASAVGTMVADSTEPVESVA